MYETDLLLFILFVVLFIYVKSSIRDFFKYQKLFRNIQGPKTLPLSLIAYIFTARSESGEVVKSQVGIISALLKSSSHSFDNSLTDRFQILQKLSKKYPNFYSLWFGTKYLFVTDDPDIAQKLLTYPQCVEKNFFMELFGFPNGLISLKCKWKSESFAPFHCCRSVDVAVGEAETIIENLSNKVFHDKILFASWQMEEWEKTAQFVVQSLGTSELCPRLQQLYRAKHRTV